jgi:hypothetical protein
VLIIPVLAGLCLGSSVFYELLDVDPVIGTIASIIAVVVSGLGVEVVVEHDNSGLYEP